MATSEALNDALDTLRVSLKRDAEVRVNEFEETTGLSISRITITMHELSTLPHPLYAVKAVDVEIATE